MSTTVAWVVVAELLDTVPVVTVVVAKVPMAIPLASLLDVSVEDRTGERRI